MSERQQNEVELASICAFGTEIRMRLATDAPVDVGDRVVLLDTEATEVATLLVRSAVLSTRAPTGTSRIGSGAAPEPPHETLVSGVASLLRNFGHRQHSSLRGWRGMPRVHRAAVVTGVFPAKSDLRWSSAAVDVVVILDMGIPQLLSSNVRNAQMCGLPVVVLPAPDPTSRDDVSWRSAVIAAVTSCVSDVVELWHTPVPRGRGRVVFFTGLSGSGKSTIAKHLLDALGINDDRPTTLLDGDEIRRVLSADLTFSAADRIVNNQRIGWVAKTIAAHGGTAICAPIAPYEWLRSEIRERVEEVADFLLVHVATPLEVCERRDRKGLYARARLGSVQGFTGIDDPYEIPLRPDVTIGPSMSPSEAAQLILDSLSLLEKRQRDAFGTGLLGG